MNDFIVLAANDFLKYDFWKNRCSQKQIIFIQFRLMKVIPFENNIIQFQQLQSRLNKFAYLSKGPLPGAADALIFQKLKSIKRIPSRSVYQNFYHWYVTIAQFADKEVESWKIRRSQLKTEKLIVDCLHLIDQIEINSPRPHIETPISYVMNIFVKLPLKENIEKIRDTLSSVKGLQIQQPGELQLKYFQERNLDLKEIDDQIRVRFRMRHSECEKFQESVLKFEQVDRIQVRRMMKERRISSTKT